MSVRVEGADKLALVGKAVRRLGTDRTIVTQLAKRIRRLGTPVRQEIKAAALARLPKRGGLNLWVAKAPVRVNVRRGADNAGVEIAQGRDSKRGRSDLRRIDKGKLRHPAFGHGPWSSQSIEVGYFTDAVTGPVGDQFRVEVVGAVDDAVAEVLRALG